MTLFLNILFADLDFHMAQFVSALSSALSGYIPPGEVFVNYLNMALPRLYSLGYWRDLVYEYKISTDRDYFYIPREAESLMSAVIEGYPVDLNARWQDYKTSGRFDDSPNHLYGAVDDGLHPTKFEFDGVTKYQLKVVPVTPEVTLPAYGSVYVTYVKSNCQKVIHNFQLNGSAYMQTAFSDANSVVDVELIRFDGVPTMVEVQAISGPCSSSSSSSSPSSGVTSYQLEYHALYYTDACLFGTPTTYFSTGAPLAIGMTIYNDSSLTTAANSGYFSDGVNYFNHDNSTGIQSIGTCPTPSSSSSA